MKSNLRVVLLGLASLLFAAGAHAVASYRIGVYYFPGWTDGAKGLNSAYPWAPIQKYPERKPMLGWYRDSDPAVVLQQIKWMAAHGINYVVFDSYWKNDEPFLDHTLVAYKKVKSGMGVSYGLLWANHFHFEGGWRGFNRMVNYWVDHHFIDPDYLKVDGKPVLFVFSLDEFVSMAASLKVSPSELVGRVNEAARLKGLPGVYLVAATPGLAHWVKAVGPEAGFSAYSAYNYHVGYRGEASLATPKAHSFDSMREAYRVNWKWIIENGDLKYIVPMTSGWDDRPWRGEHTKEEQSPSTLKQFEAHLREARALMDAHPMKTMKMGVICCWNEFGEGSYVEPTVAEGFQRLQVIKLVFGGK
jgi:hypothetical protein